MLKNISQLETMVSGKIHRYLCENDSQIDHVIEALVQFLSYAKQIKDTIAAQQASKLEKDQSESQQTDASHTEE